jgi:hypothetical protein
MTMVVAANGFILKKERRPFMRKLISIAAFAATLLAFSPVFAAEHAYITSVRLDIPSENVYRVNIEKVDGSEKGLSMSSNHRVPAGKHSIDISLVFNPKWSSGMDKTIDNIYHKTIEMDFAAGKTYHIGAKVDTNASADAIKDGSFWEPVLHSVD